MQRVLVTGIAGFAGSHLAERLAGANELWGVCLDSNVANLSGVKGLNLVECDLLDYGRVVELVRKVRPERVYHLAAQSIPSLSFSHPGETLRTNIFSTLNLFEALVDSCPDATILNIGSGDEYGDVAADELPVSERSELRPLNPYAVSKVTQDLLAFQYWRTKGLKAVRARPFNHFGPRQADTFVTAEFARQIAEIEAGIRRDKVLKVGNLEAAKDFLDVRDMVAAYEILAERGAPGEVYNICSGKAWKIGEIARMLVALSTERVEIAEDPSKRRPTDAAAIYGDASRVRSLGWSPRYSMEESLGSLLEYWRERVGRGD